MTLTAIFRDRHLEPPPWLYAPLAQGSLMRLIYRLFVQDLARELAPETRLLDVGTGPGYLLGYLARLRPDLSLWGLDCDYGMIRRARPRQRLTAPAATPQWLVADACDLPLADGVFGQAVATFSFHVWPCPRAGLQELGRVLQPGGRAWVYELRREASRRDLRAFARRTGLPYPLVYLGFKSVSRHHAWPEDQLRRILQEAAGDRGSLQPAHHLFWRAELQGGEAGSGSDLRG
jgi:ubiquinone/menaquinone biosynthesis C-methylase UbiE